MLRFTMDNAIIGGSISHLNELKWDFKITAKFEKKKKKTLLQ